MNEMCPKAASADCCPSEMFAARSGHIPCYRSISAEAMMNVDDEDDDDDDENEASDDEASSGDEDFVADDALEDDDEEDESEDTESSQDDVGHLEEDNSSADARKAKQMAKQQVAFEKRLQASAERVCSWICTCKSKV
jgi:hypothetical protein